jgi:mannose-6-phosphate isomerase-like protein (cupin superfamily)
MRVDLRGDDSLDDRVSAGEKLPAGNYNPLRSLRSVDGRDGLVDPTTALRPPPSERTMSKYTPESDTRTAGDRYQVLGATLSITADRETTGGEYLVLDMLVPPAFENWLYTHEQSEVFHVVEGEARLHVDGRDQTLDPGTTGYVPGGEVHGFAKEGDDVRRVIAVMRPAGAEDLFREGGQPTDDRSLPEPVEPTGEMLQSLFAIGDRDGFEFPGPLPGRAD